MGYRSEVGFAISSEAYTQYKILEQRPLTVLDEFDNKYKNELGFYFITSSIKWYDSYDEIKEMEDLMDQMDENEDPDICYAFVKFGEDENDNETRGAIDYFDLYLERIIETPSNLELI